MSVICINEINVSTLEVLRFPFDWLVSPLFPIHHIAIGIGQEPRPEWLLYGCQPSCQSRTVFFHGPR